MSSIIVAGDTSGTVTLAAPAVAGTTTLTLPSTSGTVLTTASGQWITTGSDIYYNTGNVLIGTSSALNTSRIISKSTFASPTGAAVDYGSLYVYSGGSVAANTGGVISLGGTYDNTGNGDTRWAVIAGLKENATNGEYGGYLSFYTRANGSTPAERMRIDSSGNVLVGTTSNFASGNVQGIAAQASGNASLALNRTTDTGAVARFYQAGTNVGRIEVTGSATSYVTSSDYRLKENIAPMTGALDKIAQLKPVTYTWKLDGSNGQGFIAHELQAVVPECVTGQKDAVNEDGSINPQGIDTSFLVATLTAAIKEQQELIKQLQADVAALKGAA